MKKLTFAFAAISLVLLAPVSARLGSSAASLAIVAAGVALALAASGSLHSLAIAAGAAGAFAGGVLAPVSPAAAGAVFVGAAFAERTSRVTSPVARAVHVLMAILGGGIAGALANAYVSASLTERVVAAVVAGAVAALPLLVVADDPIAHALEQASRAVSEPAKRALRDGAELRRTADGIPLGPVTAKHVRATWSSLLRLAEARMRLERTPRWGAGLPALTTGVATESTEATDRSGTAMAVLRMIDQRVVEHVDVLGRAYAAVDSAGAARVGVDDAALKSVASIGESLDDVSRALVEVRND